MGEQATGGRRDDLLRSQGAGDAAALRGQPSPVGCWGWLPARRGQGAAWPCHARHQQAALGGDGVGVAREEQRAFRGSALPPIEAPLQAGPPPPSAAALLPLYCLCVGGGADD